MNKCIIILVTVLYLGGDSICFPGQSMDSDSNEVDEIVKSVIVGMGMDELVLRSHQRGFEDAHLKPGVTEGFHYCIYNKIDEEFIMNLLVPIFKKNYTKGGLTKLKKFFKSSTGEKYKIGFTSYLYPDRPIPVFSEDDNKILRRYGYLLRESLFDKILVETTERLTKAKSILGAQCIKELEQGK